MSAMLTGVMRKLKTPKQLEPVSGMKLAEMLYADDTFLVGTHTHLHTIDKLLHAIQIESDYYNMKLNCDRCSTLTVNQHKSSVRYLHGRLVPRKHEAVYLGSLLTDTIDNHGEVAVRLAGATTTCNRLKLFRKKAQNPIARKLRVFDQSSRAKSFMV